MSIEKIKSLKNERYSYDIEVIINEELAFSINVDSNKTVELYNSSLIEGLSLNEIIKLKKLIIKKGYSVASFNGISLGQLLSRRIRYLKDKKFFKLVDCLA